MFKQGPIPAFVHGVIEYLAAALFIAAPFLFSFDDDTATAVSIVVGVLILIVTASTALPTGLIKSIPVQAHAVIDFAAGGGAHRLAVPVRLQRRWHRHRVLHRPRGRPPAADDRDALRQRRAPAPPTTGRLISLAFGASVSCVPGFGRIV